MSAFKDLADKLRSTKANGQIDIYCDSQAAILALNSREIKSRLVKESISSLNRIARTNKVTIRWIKAHVGHPGNEHADLEAKLGSEAELLEGELPAPTSKATCKMLVKTYIRDLWNLEWLSLIHI